MGMPLMHHRFTAEEYHRMGETGILHQDDRLELLDGQIVEMTPIGPAHGGCVKRLTALFSRLPRSETTLSIQDPVALGRHQEPQPDVALLGYRADGYRSRHPGPADVLLIVEVADTSAASDRQAKVPLYAAAGIPETWLVNLPEDTVEIYRDPGPRGYAAVRTARPGESIAPALLPRFSVRVEEILTEIDRG